MSSPRIHSLGSKKELYDLSQRFMLMSRYVSLFTRVIWSHPEASKNAEVNRCRAKAIEYLHSIPPLRTRMFSIWEKGQWTGEASGWSSEPPLNTVTPVKYPSPDSTFPSTEPATYPKLDTGAPDVRLGYPHLPASRMIELPSSISRVHTPTGKLTIPFDLPATFQHIASSNTVKGIETCGVLLGYKQEESILITSIVVPKQTGTSDTCEALPGAEEQILSYALTNELLCVGWIHTHPTQSCFLSSIDLHTTLPYQQMLPDAVAIVIAPTDATLPVGVFRLSRAGLGAIKNCSRRGFHSHEVDESLTTVVTDINWDTTANVVIVDLRK